MRRYFKVFLIFCGVFNFFVTTQAARRPGVMRPVSLVAPNQASLEGNFYNGTWHMEPRSKVVSLIFTREVNGTRNLWQATAEAEGHWNIKPLTNLPASQWVDHAQPLPDGRTLICVTNAFGDGQMPHIARFDLKTGRLEVLLREGVPGHSPSVSPDGRSLAFVRDAFGVPIIFLLPLNNAAMPGAVRRVIEGRHPAWLDNSTLLFSDARKNGLYRLEIPRDWPPLQALKTVPQGISWRSGRINVAPDGRQLCLVQEATNGAAGQLFFMAPNGSGERVLRNTEGALAPRFAPDNSALLFDAPLQNNGPRTLWIMNLTPITPTIELSHVAVQSASAYQVVGTVFCEDSPDIDVKLEVGEGEAPQRWQLLGTPRAPLQKETLAVWQIPQQAQGDWTLRLTARSPDGDTAQATMTLALPLKAGAIVANASPDVAISVAPVTGAAGLIGTHGIASRVVSEAPKVFPDRNHTTVPDPMHPDLLPPSSKNTSVSSPPGLSPAAPPQRVEKSPPANTAAPSGGALQLLPLPALPPPPFQNRNTAANNTIPTSPLLSSNSTATNTTPTLPQRIVQVPPQAPPIVQRPPVTQTPILVQGPINLQAPPARHQNPNFKTAVPKATLPKATAKAPAKAPSKSQEAAPDRGAAQWGFAVPRRVKSGTEVQFNGQLRNEGKSVWNASSSSPARVLVRWFDRDTKQRARWEIKHLPASVEPGQSVTLSFSVTAPRPGNYYLQASIVRLPGGKYQPTSTTLSEPLDTLAQTTYRVTVE